ncbi:sigma-70 family RNA polymerase sigma factor [Streptomyces sp. NPDC004549]|uniref:RNA polymerase sigma factor n=1 Tax=Streptomyces sp. NPDC004549 TaxID=3154283 RepID=UPI0033AB5136
MTFTDQSDENGCGAGTFGAAEATSEALDEARFNELYGANRDRLSHLMWKKTGNRVVVEDLVGETLERFVRAWQKQPDHPAPAGLLFQIARWRLADHLRKQGRELTVEPGDLEDLAGSVGGDDFAAVERREDVRKALATLREQDRQALLLQHVAKLTVAECAAVMCESEHNMKKILERARRALERAPGIDVYRSAGMAKEVRG